MNSHSVPNITIGPLRVEALHPLSKETGALLDVHLMVEESYRCLADFVYAGADIGAVHVEAYTPPHRTTHQITGLEARVGVTLNRATSPATLE